MADDLEARLREQAAKVQKFMDNNQIVIDLLAPQMQLFENREGHNLYAVRMSVEHQSSNRSNVKELAMLTEAADALAAARGMAEALEWYANPISYAVTQMNEPRSAVHGDSGKRARHALAAFTAAVGDKT